MRAAAESGSRRQAEPARMLDGLRVLVLTSGHPLSDQRVYGKVARSISAMGADVTLVGLADGGRIEGMRAVGLRRPGSRACRILLQTWRCLLASRRIPADIVHFHDAEMLVTLPVAKLLRPRAKFIYDVHEDISNLIRIRDWLPPALRSAMSLGVNFCEKTLARLADAVIGVTPPLTEKFSNRLQATAYNFVAQDYFELAARSARPAAERDYAVIHVGTLSRPRARFLAETLAALRRRHAGARALVVGCGSEMASFLQPLVPQGTDVIDRVLHRDVPALVGRARIGLDVHPWPQPHLDVALPVKVCEYLASACGVVASTMPVLRRLYAESGANLDGLRLIEGGTPALFAEELSRMLGLIAEHPALGRRNREFALQYMNWDTEARKIGDLYRRLRA